MNCLNCGQKNREEARFCDGCGSRLQHDAFDPAGELYIGREKELRMVLQALDDAAAGHGRILLISGEPGIGKTSTAGIAAELAKGKSFSCHWGHCYDGSGAPPYWPWMQLLRSWLESCSDDVLHTYPPERLGRISELVSEIHRRFPDLPLPESSAGDDVARFKLFDAITGIWTKEAQSEPLLLVIDDLHWADIPSLKLLEFFSREVSSRPLVLLITYRDTEIGRDHPVSSTLGDLSRRPGLLRLQLKGLNLLESSQFMAIVSGSSLPTTMVTNIHDRTEGNPLYLSEMARYLHKEKQTALFNVGADSEEPGPLPLGIKEVISRRLMQLSPECNAFLDMAAVIGRRFKLLLLHELLPESLKTQQKKLLGEALEAHILQAAQDTGSYQFSHALIRDALYEDLEEEERLELHRQIAERLEQAHQQQPMQYVIPLAYHAFAALPLTDTGQVLNWVTAAGKRAAELLAFEDASRYFKQALSLTEGQSASELQQQLYRQLGLSLLNAGENLQALAAFRGAADMAEQLAMHEAFAEAAISFEEASWRIGIPGHKAVEILRKAETYLGNSDERLRIQLLSALTRALIFVGQLEESRQVNAEAEMLARKHNDAASLVFVLLSGLAARWGPERLASRLSAAREAMQLAQQQGDKLRLVDLAGWYMFDLMEAGDHDAALQAFEMQTRLAQSLHQPYWLYVGALFKTTMALFHGQLQESERLAVRAAEIGEQLTGQDTAGVFGLQIFNLRREQGRLAEIEPVLTQFLKHAPKENTWRPGLAILYTELGRLDEARIEFDALAEDDFAVIPRDALWPGCLTYLSEVCVQLDDKARAAQLYEYLLPHDGYNIVVGAFTACHGAAARLIGMLATTLERWEDAERHFTSAIASNKKQGAAPWLAHSYYEYARMYLLRLQEGDQEQAQTLLDQAQAMTHQLEMKGLDRRIHALKQQLESHSQKQCYPSNLTRREVEVLQLVSQGKSNREIAEVLFRSENTVANHIRHILEKTETANRAEAVAFALRNGLAEV